MTEQAAFGHEQARHHRRHATADIAAVVEITPGTVMSSLARARHKLQAELLALHAKESSHGQ